MYFLPYPVIDTLPVYSKGSLCVSCLMELDDRSNESLKPVDIHSVIAAIVRSRTGAEINFTFWLNTGNIT